MLIEIRNEPPKSPIHLIWGGLVVLTVIFVRVFSDFLCFLPLCPFRELTGIPCLTCGGVHSIEALSRFDFRAFFLSNPMAASGIIGLEFFSLSILAGIVLKKRLIVALLESEKKILRIIIFFFALSNWAFLIYKNR